MCVLECEGTVLECWGLSKGGEAAVPTSKELCTVVDVLGELHLHKSQESQCGTC